MLIALLMFGKWWKFITKKNLVTSLMFILIFFLEDKVYNDFKD
jgi:hypothetical protein